MLVSDVGIDSVLTTSLKAHLLGVHQTWSAAAVSLSAKTWSTISALILYETNVFVAILRVLYAASDTRNYFHSVRTLAQYPVEGPVQNILPGDVSLYNLLRGNSIFWLFLLINYSDLFITFTYLISNTIQRANIKWKVSLQVRVDQMIL